MSEESRLIAEVFGPDRDRRAREVRERAERRERIATQALIGICAHHGVPNLNAAAREWALDSVTLADALIRELDRRRDADLEEARS